jgi:hypothetical protein
MVTRTRLNVTFIRTLQVLLNVNAAEPVKRLMGGGSAFVGLPFTNQ